MSFSPSDVISIQFLKTRSGNDQFCRLHDFTWLAPVGPIYLFIYLFYIVEFILGRPMQKGKTTKIYDMYTLVNLVFSWPMTRAPNWKPCFGRVGEFIYKAWRTSRNVLRSVLLSPSNRFVFANVCKLRSQLRLGGVKCSSGRTYGKFYSISISLASIH